MIGRSRTSGEHTEGEVHRPGELRKHEGEAARDEREAPEGKANGEMTRWVVCEKQMGEAMGGR